jgi:hypothetical protein
MVFRLSQGWAIVSCAASVRLILLPKKRSPELDWSNALFQVIDLASFSSVWYWIIVALTWSSVSYYVLGIPFDMIQRARRKGGEAEADLHDILRVNVNRVVHIGQIAGLMLIAFANFMLTGLGLLAFYYWIELAQAVFLLAFPLSIVATLSFRTVRKIAEQQPQDEDVYKVLFRHRLWTQIIGMVAIFFTAMFGMYQNLDIIRYL